MPITGISFKLRLFAVEEVAGEEAYEEDDDGAEDDGEILVEARLRQSQPCGGRYPSDDDDAAHHSDDSIHIPDPL